MYRREKVAIFGAGIGGLSAAHELLKRGFDVSIYERRNVVGGLARSEGQAGTGAEGRPGAPGEYSWRTYGERYYNLLDILREIPVGNGRTAFDNLVEVGSYVFPRADGEIDIVGKTSGDSWREQFRALRRMAGRGTMADAVRAFEILLFTLTASAERINALDEVPWVRFIQAEEWSEVYQHHFVNSFGPYYGTDAEKMSTATALYLLDLAVYYTFSNSHVMVMNKPTNEAFFEPWVRHLKAQGATFQLETELVELQEENGRVAGAIIECHGERRRVEADFFVCGLSAEAIAKVVERSRTVAQRSPTLAEMRRLATMSEQCMLSIQYFFDSRISLPREHSLLHFLDTPWAIIVEPEGTFWGDGLQGYGDGRIRDVWSVGICRDDVPGILVKKPMRECTREEVEFEAWAQLMSAPGVVEQFRTEDGRSMKEAGYLGCYVWHTYQHRDGRFVSEEPKFSNNAGTLRYRPDAATEFSNFFFATAYTKTRAHIFSMESAAEGGVLAANAVMDRSSRSADLARCPVKAHERTLPLVFGPARAADKLLFQLKLPHLGRALLSPLKRWIRNEPPVTAKPEEQPPLRKAA